MTNIIWLNETIQKYWVVHGHMLPILELVSEKLNDL